MSELCKVEKEGDKVKIILKVGESENTEMEGIKPKLLQFNELVFESLDDCVKYFTALDEHNKAVVVDNKKRLDQIDANSLEKLNDFVEVIKKTGALGSKRAKKIDGLITAHETMLTLKFNIKSTESKNQMNVDILEQLKQLE